MFGLKPAYSGANTLAGFFLLNYISAVAEVTKYFKNQNSEINRQRNDFVNRHLFLASLSIIRNRLFRLSSEARPPLATNATIIITFHYT